MGLRCGVSNLVRMISRRRNSNRLLGYDYSLPGAYFVTLVAKDRRPLFGEMAGEKVVLNRVGRIVREEWVHTGKLRPDITLDEFVVMPDHFHAILFINDVGQKEMLGAHRGAPLHRKPRSLGSIMAGFKSVCSQTAGFSLWQRNYYDRIIRNQTELDNIREYILYNPLKLLEGW